MPKHTYDKGTANFRTIRNLRGYDDSERGFPPPEVDDTDYEDINVLVKRFMKGEILKVGKAVSFDGVGSAEELMAAASPLQVDGADLADVGPIKDGIKERANERKKEASKPKPAPGGGVGTSPKPDAGKPQGGEPTAPAEGSSGK